MIIFIKSHNYLTAMLQNDEWYRTETFFVFPLIFKSAFVLVSNAYLLSGRK